jgi:hypothetical protein
VRPPRLTNRSPTGTDRTAIDQNLRHGLLVSGADVAPLMLAVLDRPETIGHPVGVAD